MTNKESSPEMEESKKQTQAKSNKAIKSEAKNTDMSKTPEKPPISKVSGSPEKHEPQKAVAPNETEKATNGAAPIVAHTNGSNGVAHSADTASKGQKALLEVDNYNEAEALVTSQPELIEPARIVFGSVVPTIGQNQFVDLVIKAAAEDDAMTLGSALETKRRTHLNLTGPEVSQLLEFADESVAKYPLLALYAALLLTDDLIRLEDADLWQKQKAIILQTEQSLDLDATALWASINEPEKVPEVQAVEEKPEPEPVEPVVTEKPKKKKRPAPPPPPIQVKKKSSGGSPPRWLVASGFVFLLSMMSCGACALTWF